MIHYYGELRNPEIEDLENHHHIYDGNAAELIDKIKSFEKLQDFEKYYNRTYGGEPLHHAIRYNNINVAKILILRGADVNKQDLSLHTPLYYALRADDEAMVSMLLNNNVSARGIFDKARTRTYYFQYVCENSNAKIVKLFLSKGCTANDLFRLNNYNCERKSRPLHAAIMNGKIETVKILINCGADVNQKNLLGETPLYLACMEGLIDISVILLNNNALVNVITKNNKTPLYEAIKLCDSHTVKLLLENGAIVDNKDPNIIRNICNPLHKVIKNGGVEIVQYLLEAGLNPDLKASLEGAHETRHFDYSQEPTFLHTAVANNKIEMVELFLNYDADMYIRNKIGHIPLHTAADNKNKDIMEMLLEVDPHLEDSIGESTINVQDSSGYTPLHIACFRQSPECIQLLMDKGADLTAETHNGDTVLHLATAFNCASIVQQLVNSNVSINVLNNDLNSPLHLAVWKRSPTIVELFLENNAATICENEDHLIPLDVALKHRHHADIMVISHLLRYAEDINDSYHKKAFCLAMSEMSEKEMAIKVFDLFFKYGFTLNPENDDINSFLYVAARNGHTTIVQMLLDLGADPNTKVNVESVLHATTKKKHAETISILLKHGADARATNEEGKLALHIAVANSDSESFDVLLHSSVDAKTLPGLLQYVVRKCPLNCFEFIRILVERGADVNAYYDDKNILHYLISSLEFQPSRLTSRSKAISYVLDKGVHVDAKTSTGLTALHLAAVGRNADIVKMLLDYDADVDAQANHGATPLAVHCVARSFPCIEVLLDNGADMHARDSRGFMAMDVLLDAIDNDQSHWIDQWRGKVIEMCDMHVARLRLAGLYVHPEILQRLRRPPQVELEKRCRDELEHLKRMKLNPYVSAYDLLVRNLTDVARFVADDQVRTRVKEEMRSGKYPIYGNFLISQLTRVSKRDPYLSSAESVLMNRIYEKPLPDICTAKITGYLDAVDLMNLASFDVLDISIPKEEMLAVVHNRTMYTFVAKMFRSLTSRIWRVARSLSMYRRRV